MAVKLRQRAADLHLQERLAIRRGQTRPRQNRAGRGKKIAVFPLVQRDGRPLLAFAPDRGQQFARIRLGPAGQHLKKPVQHRPAQHGAVGIVALLPPDGLGAAELGGGERLFGRGMRRGPRADPIGQGGGGGPLCHRNGQRRLGPDAAFMAPHRRTIERRRADIPGPGLFQPVADKVVPAFAIRRRLPRAADDQPALRPRHRNVEKPHPFFPLAPLHLVVKRGHLRRAFVGRCFPDRRTVADQHLCPDLIAPLGGVGQDDDRRLKPLRTMDRHHPDRATGGVRTSLHIDIIRV